MELPEKIEIYSAMPYAGGDDSTIDDWFHISRNEIGEHIEAVWDIETIFRPEIKQENKATKLMGLESYFTDIRLHYALNYTAWRYHEDLLIWAIKALKPGGKLSVISPDIDNILKYWLADALSAELRDFSMDLGLKEENEKLRSENAQLRKALQVSSSPWYNIGKKDTIKSLLQQVGIPEDQFEQLDRNELIKSVPDKIHKEIIAEWEFDLWLMQQLYSSGASEPQDCFKAIFGKRYLSTLLRRTQFVITLLQNNPQNPMQIEAKAFKHPSRILTSQNIKIL